MTTIDFEKAPAIGRVPSLLKRLIRAWQARRRLARRQMMRGPGQRQSLWLDP